MENGHNMPAASSLIPLSRALGCSIDWILTGEENIARNSERANRDCIPDKNLTGDEAALIMMYQSLPDEQKEDIFDIVQLKYDKYLQRKEAFASLSKSENSSVTA